MERLFINAAEIGLRSDEVGAMSNYELSLQFQGAQQRIDGWYKLGLFIAWHTANFSAAASVGQLPDLKATMAKMDRKQHKQTPGGQLAVLHQIAAAHGLTLQFRPKKAKKGS